MWYDVNKTLSHNCLFNFVLGPRGVGKTYAAKRKVIRDFLKSGAQFVYLRRFDTEIKQSQLNNFFTDIAKEFPEHELTSKQRTFYLDEQPIGWAIPLSKAAQYKSVPFPNVSLIIYDEFIIDQGLVRYLPNEVQSFLEMYSTIARLRDVRVLFLSNAITFTNPYFIYFNIENPIAKNGIWKKGDILVQYVESPEYTETARSTRFGKLIAGTSYDAYANNNEFLRDNNDFISKLPDGLTCRAILKVEGQSFGLFSGGREFIWYVSDKYDPTCKLSIAMDYSSFDEDAKFKSGDTASTLWVALQRMYYNGKVRFTSVKVKNMVSSKIMNIWR